MYIFAKLVAGHIFLQNRDKINIKKIRATKSCLLGGGLLGLLGLIIIF
jgi:hypothetical protein